MHRSSLAKPQIVSLLTIVIRGAVALSGALVVLTALVGFAHTKQGRPLLVWLGHARGHGGSACPLGYGGAATAEQREGERARFAAMHRGAAPSGGRPALGFALDRTTRGDVVAWATSHHVTCGAGQGAADLRCTAVGDELLAPPLRELGAETVWFVFGASDRLISVTAIATADRPEAISATYRAVVAAIDGQAGPASSQDGDASPAALAAGTLAQASAEYKFRDYYAVARATNVGRGYALTEEYRSLPN